MSSPIKKPDQVVVTEVRVSYNQVIKLYRKTKGAEAPLMEKRAMLQSVLKHYLPEIEAPAKRSLMTPEQQDIMKRHFQGYAPTHREVQTYIASAFGIDYSLDGCSKLARQLKEASNGE